MFETDESIDCFLLFYEGIKSQLFPFTLMLSFFLYFCRATAFYLNLTVLLDEVSFLDGLGMASARELLVSFLKSKSSLDFIVLGTIFD